MVASKKILILFGPNLNMIGLREPDIYGHETHKDIVALCRRTARRLGMKTDIRQSNYEGDLVMWLQKTMGKVDGIIINAGAYTHTSIAIHDALKLHKVPIVEVHMSNPKERESFRHLSYIEPVAAICFAGIKSEGYVKALEFLDKFKKA